MLELVWRLLQSQAEDSLKKMLSKKLIEAAVKLDMDQGACLSTLRELTRLLLTCGEEYVKQNVLHSLPGFLECHPGLILEYLDGPCLEDLFTNTDYTNRINLLGLVLTLLSYFMRENPGNRQTVVFNSLRTRLLKYLKTYGSDKSIAVAVGYLYKSYLQTLPATLGEQVNLCLVVVELLAGYSNPTLDQSVDFRSQMNQISNIIPTVYERSVYQSTEGSAKIWLEVLKYTYSLISNTVEKDEMVALCFLIEHVPSQFMNIATKTILDEVENGTGEEGLVKALCRLIHSICIWPLPRISAWVLEILRSVGAECVLRRVAEECTVKLLRGLETPLHRRQTEEIFFMLLYGDQNSPNIFNKIVPLLPDALKKLTSSSASDTAARDTADRLMEATIYMLDLYPGTWDLNGSLTAAVKSTSISGNRKDILSRKAWRTSASPSSYIASSLHRSSHFVGLINLGNTCYMNSVIQALFMARKFTASLLNLPTMTGQPVTRSLQTLMAFLKYSQRNIFSPTEFHRTANPSWFTKGRQHDCSEFLSYLMDTCHEEQKAFFALSENIENSKTAELVSIVELPEDGSEPVSQVEDWRDVPERESWDGSNSSLCAQADSQENLQLIETDSQEHIHLIGDSRENLDISRGDSQDHLDLLDGQGQGIEGGSARDMSGYINMSQDDNSFLQEMGSTENLWEEKVEQGVEQEDSERDHVGELRASRDNIIGDIGVNQSRENLNLSRSSLLDDEHLSRVSRGGSKGSLVMSRWTTEENLSLSSGSREFLSVSGSRELLNVSGSRELLNRSSSRELLNVSGCKEPLKRSPSKEALNRSSSKEALNRSSSKEALNRGSSKESLALKDGLMEYSGSRDPVHCLDSSRDTILHRPRELRLEEDKSLHDAHSNSTDSGIHSVGESNHSNQEKLSEPGAVEVRGAEWSLVERYFGGRMEISVRCHLCNKQSRRHDYFTQLGLSFPPKTVTKDLERSDNTNPSPESTMPCDNNETESSDDILVNVNANVINSPPKDYQRSQRRNGIDMSSACWNGGSGAGPIIVDSCSITEMEFESSVNSSTRLPSETGCESNLPNEDSCGAPASPPEGQSATPTSCGDTPSSGGDPPALVASEVDVMVSVHRTSLTPTDHSDNTDQLNMDVDHEMNAMAQCSSAYVDPTQPISRVGSNSPTQPTSPVGSSSPTQPTSLVSKTPVDQTQSPTSSLPTPSMLEPKVCITTPDVGDLSNSILSGLGRRKGETNPVQGDLSLGQLLHNYMEPEILEGCNQYRCDNCNRHTDATQTLHITSPPKYLILALNRFEYDRVLGRKQKIFTQVNYPHRLDLPVNHNKELVKYILQSIIVHSGYSSDSGHYYTWARDQDDESVWHIFNDSVVSTSSWSNFIDQNNRLVRDTPYILLYSAVEGDDAVDEPLQPSHHLVQQVQRDNEKYAREKQGEYNRVPVSGMSKPARRDDEDQGPGPSCGDSFASFGGAGRFVF